MIAPEEREILSRDYRIEVVRLSDIRTNIVPNTRGCDSYEVDALADSIRRVGLLDPLIVRDGPAGLDLICGHRRFAALMSLHETEAPCRIVRATDQECAQLNVIENLARKTLTPPEAAMAVEALCASGSSPIDVARMTGQRYATIERWRLLRRGLTPAMWERFCHPIDSISHGVARKDYRETLFARIARHKPQDQAAYLAIYEGEHLPQKKGRPKGSKNAVRRGEAGGMFIPSSDVLAICQAIEDSRADHSANFNEGAWWLWVMVRRAGKMVRGTPT